MHGFDATRVDNPEEGCYRRYMEQSQKLRKGVENCKLCPLYADRAHAVPALPGANYQQGGIALMLESPNYHDARSGKPFTRGNSYRSTMGNTLDNVLDALAVSTYEDETLDTLERSNLLFMTSVRCKPEHRLSDHPEAIHGCGEWTTKELEHYEPGLVIFAGNQHLAKTMYGAKVGPKGAHGAVRAADGRLWGLTYSFGAVFHNPEVADIIVEDLKLYKRVWEGQQRELSF